MNQECDLFIGWWFVFPVYFFQQMYVAFHQLFVQNLSESYGTVPFNYESFVGLRVRWQWVQLCDLVAQNYQEPGTNS